MDETVSQNPPVAVVTAAIGTGFALVWPTYPDSVSGDAHDVHSRPVCGWVASRLLVAGPLGGRKRYVVTLDDAVSPALGLPTPLDR